MALAEDKNRIAGDGQSGAARTFVASRGFGPFIGFAVVLLAGLLLVACGIAEMPLIDIAPSRFIGTGLFLLCWASVYGVVIAVTYSRMGATHAQLESEVQRQQGFVDAIREARDAAEATSVAKSGFLASMSHELRTPLNAVIGFSEMMLGEAFGPLGHERYRSYAKDIHDSGWHLLAIINDILDVAKAESGKFELDEEVFDCREIISEAAIMLRPRVNEAGLILETDLPANIPQLRADRRRTKQILLNLIDNAVKFTPSGGRVSITVSCELARGLIVAVHDTGIGIAGEHLKKVLQPFVQVTTTARRAKEGTGLGLPLVRVMMERHGGALELESELGKSTTARVVFPPHRLVACEPQDPSQPVDGQSEPAPGTQACDLASGPTVLVVDDDENLRLLLARILVRSGYRAITAMDGVDALKYIRSQCIDLVMTDMLMPEMDGTELIRTMQTDGSNVPVIAMSGVVDWKDRLRGAERLGARTILSKPFSGPQLLSAVRRTLHPPKQQAVA
jgi:signal transduction histidine kinase/ActR/RegA family two-component response regulator